MSVWHGQVSTSLGAQGGDGVTLRVNREVPDFPGATVPLHSDLKEFAGATS